MQRDVAVPSPMALIIILTIIKTPIVNAKVSSPERTSLLASCTLRVSSLNLAQRKMPPTINTMDDKAIAEIYIANRKLKIENKLE